MGSKWAPFHPHGGRKSIRILAIALSFIRQQPAVTASISGWAPMTPRGGFTQTSTSFSLQRHHRLQMPPGLVVYYGLISCPLATSRNPTATPHFSFHDMANARERFPPIIPRNRNCRGRLTWPFAMAMLSRCSLSGGGPSIGIRAMSPPKNAQASRVCSHDSDRQFDPPEPECSVSWESPAIRGTAGRTKKTSGSPDAAVPNQIFGGAGQGPGILCGQ